jgi:L-alanine-DL-glutamate epimerase-like enolase superfamily enzyme
MESNYWKYTHQFPHFVDKPPQPANGSVAPPEGPGIGVGIKPEILKNGDALVEVVAGA